MTTPIIFPDADMWAVKYLQGALPLYGYPDMFVHIERQSQASAVWVRRDGGPTLDQVREAPRLGINVFAPTEKDVSDLARTVSALMRAAAGSGQVKRVTQTMGPSPIADSSPRRYMTFEVVLTGSELVA